ncbi:MAG: peptidase C45, partial [Bryobacteraceae bacterium]|nr:peptidase C45 [Bryobacteraceae bacterium]
MKQSGPLLALLVVVCGVGLLMSKPDPAGPIANASRAEKKGWIEVRLEGSPRELGYQHGWLLFAEIEDALQVTRLSLTHDGKRDWDFSRGAAKTVFWPGIPPEYRGELEGIVEGLTARGVKADIWDIVAHNAQIEFGYYTAWLDRQSGKPAASGA